MRYIILFTLSFSLFAADSKISTCAADQALATHPERVEEIERLKKEELRRKVEERQSQRLTPAEQLAKTRQREKERKQEEKRKNEAIAREVPAYFQRIVSALNDEHSEDAQDILQKIRDKGAPILLAETSFGYLRSFTIGVRLGEPAGWRYKLYGEFSDNHDQYQHTFDEGPFKGWHIESRAYYHLMLEPCVEVKLYAPQQSGFWARTTDNLKPVAVVATGITILFVGFWGIMDKQH